MLELLSTAGLRNLTLCFAAFLCGLFVISDSVHATEIPSPQPRQEDDKSLDLEEELSLDVILADLEQFRKLLKTEWLVATLNDVDFDAAIADLAERSTEGMSRSELVVELQKILALGNDGHAEMSHWVGTLGEFQEEQGFPDFIIDICGDDYIAYRVEHLLESSVNPRYDYQFKLLREGFPYLSAIDGVPTEKWVETISQFVPKGPELSVRWRCMPWILNLPFWRDQLGLPQSKTIKVQLTSLDKSKRVEIDAPVSKDTLFHYRIPKPDWKILDNDLGYLWIRNPAAAGVEVILEAMPQLRGTKGLIIDLRGNTGGSGAETLQAMAAFLLKPEDPRRVVLSEVLWSGRKQRATDKSFASDDNRLSDAGRKVVSSYEAHFEPYWNPPSHRAVEWRHMLVARPEAEPGIYPFNVPQFPTETFYHYPAPVVVLMDHRNFSAGELFLAGIRKLDDVTLVGSPTTSAGGTSPEMFKLEKSGLELILGFNHSLVHTNGEFIDGKGVEPDIVVPPDVDYYLGRRDRMLETAIDVLNKKIAGGR